MYNNINKPIDKINIGYNKTNEEYIGLLDEKNKIKKEIERSREYQEKQKVIEKEQGFNIHFSGANEERIKEQRRQEILRSQQQQHRAHSSSANANDQQQQYLQQQQQQQQHQKVRRQDNTIDYRFRQWKNPNSVEGRQSEDPGQVNDSKYTNPFDLGGYDKRIPASSALALGEKSPPKIRKRWGNNSNNPFKGLSSGGPTKAIHNQANNNDDEDEYSDSFEDIQQDYEDDQNRISEEKKYYNDEDEYEDKQDIIQDNYDNDEEKEDNKNDIEQFLKTATMNDINALRQQLSNFGEISKQMNTKKDFKKEDDDYIEEEFEEHIESDEDNLNQSDSDEEEKKQQEKLRQEQKLQQLKQAQQFTTQQTTRGAKNRPISATYSLATSHKVQTQRNDPQPAILQPSSSHVAYSGLGAIKDIKNYSSNNQPTSVSYASAIQETPKQPNDILKKPLNTNPFKRPFSQNIPKRGEAQNTQQNQQQEKESIQKSQNKTSDNVFSKVPISQILQKIEQLEEWQRGKLMELLDNFDNLTSSQMHNQYEQITSQQDKPSHVQKLDLNFLSPAKNQNQQPTTYFTNPNKTELIIKILKTYGNPHLCGLTELELFDLNGKKLPLVPASIILKNLGKGPKIAIARLIDGHKLTNDEKHMWIGYLPTPPQHLELLIQLEKGTQLGGLKLWNYNKSSIDCTKGIKEAQILLDGQIIWEGVLESGRGSTTTEYATFITLKEGIQLPREIKESIQETIKEEYEEEESKDQIKVVPNFQQEEQMKKYRSEVNMNKAGKQQKDKDESKSQLWLPGAPTNNASQANFERHQQVKSQQRQRTDNTGNTSGTNTFDLLEKYSTSSETTVSSRQFPQSAVGSSRPHPLRDQLKQGQSAATLIKPNASQAQQQSQIKNAPPTKPFDLGVGQVPSNQLAGGPKQWTQPFQAQRRSSLSNNQQSSPASHGQALQETSDAIQTAINKVNQVVNKHNLQQPQQKASNQVVEESLDNLDFFRATNRGRLMNFNLDSNDTAKPLPSDQSQQQQQLKPSQQSTRQKWGVSPGKNSSGSGDKQAHKSGAHVVVKNPFPVGSSGSSGLQESGAKSSARRKLDAAINLGSAGVGGGDILDQFLNNNQSKQLKDQQSLFPNHQQQPLQVQHLNYSEAQKSKLSKQSSLSPSREPVVATGGGIPWPSVKVKTYEEKLAVFSDSFMIPNLPSGQKLHLNILSTWGDMNYVGLTGIELFDLEGLPINLSASSISACPPDINILPGYGGDPRTVDKLVDGHYLTNDDLHVWLTPFTAGEDHTITVDMGNKRQIAMIRIWNYNKSRIHSYRGARLIEMQLDKKTIFRGEIQKAPGTLNEPESCCEIIMFTDNDAIMHRIDQNDWINDQVVQGDAANSNDLENTQKHIIGQLEGERPMTATKKFSATEMQEIQRQLRQQKPTSLFDERPQTSAIITSDQVEERKEQASSLRSRFDQRHQELSNQVKQQLGQQQNTSQSSFIRGRVLEFNILESWGDLFYVGLTGLEILDDRGNTIPLTLAMLDANPRDMNSMHGGGGQDYRTLDKLINKVNNTLDDRNMWLIPFNKGENHTIKIDLGKSTAISAIKFYNYNKSEEDTLRGVRQIVIQVDKKYVTPKKGVTLRKSPGLIHPLLDMGQVVKIPFKQGWTTDQIIPFNRAKNVPQQLGLFQEYDLMNLPIGFMYRLNLYSTHGDFYYIGLNGLEFFDQQGNILEIKTVIAEPQSVHKLPGMEGDVRMIENLINGVNSTYDESNMWLAPFKNTRSYTANNNSNQGNQQKDEQQAQEYRVPNYIYVIFDQPTAVSAVRLWNYAKTPSRGVNEFELLLDDKQLYRGFAKISPEKSSSSQQQQQHQEQSTVVLFTAEPKIVDKFKHSVNYDTSKQQNVTLVNEKKLMNKSQVMQAKKRPDEEFVVFNDMVRPTTMARRL